MVLEVAGRATAKILTASTPFVESGVKKLIVSAGSSLASGLASPKAAVESFLALGFNNTPHEFVFRTRELIKTLSPGLERLESLLSPDELANFRDVFDHVKEVGRLLDEHGESKSFKDLLKGGILGEDHAKSLLGLSELIEQLPDELQTENNEGLLLGEDALRKKTFIPESDETEPVEQMVDKPVLPETIDFVIDYLRMNEGNHTKRDGMIKFLEELIEGGRIKRQDIIDKVQAKGGSIPEMKISVVEPEETPLADESVGGGVAEERPTQAQQFTAEDLEKAKREGFSEGQKSSPVHEHREKPTDPMGKVLYSVGEIFRSEVENGSSELGMLAKMCAWWTGVKLDKNSIRGYVDDFAHGEIGKRLEGFIKAKFEGEGQGYSLDGMKTHEKALVQVAGTLVTLGSKIPPSWMGAFAKFGLFLDWGSEILQRIPFGGFILRIPGVRKLLTGSAQFVGRFKEPLEDIYNGVQGLKSKYVPSHEPVAVSTGDK